MNDMALEADHLADMRRALGQRVATFRQAADLTQGQLSRATFVDRTTVAHIERGRPGGDERFWRAADTACRADGALLAAFNELEAAKAVHKQQAKARGLAEARGKVASLRHTPVGLIAPSAWRSTPFPNVDDEQGALEYARRVSASDVVDDTLTRLEQIVDELAIAHSKTQPAEPKATNDHATIGHESVPAAVLLAHEIKRRRKAANLSQPELAIKIGYTRQYVSLAERVGKNLPSLELVRALDRALQSGGILLTLRNQAKAEQQHIRRRTTQATAVETVTGQPASTVPPMLADPYRARPALDPFRQFGNDERGQPEVASAFSGDDAVHAAIPRLRRALDCMDSPDDGPTRSLTELAADVAAMIEHRLQARYVEMAWRLPALISELARAHADAGHGSRNSAGLLTLALRAADGMAYKFGYLDLSARIIDLMRASAVAAEDPLLIAAVAYVRTETFFATGDLTSASRMLVTAADDLPTGFDGSAPSAAAYGALHMRGAVVAGRAGKPDTAWDHLGEAQRAARQVPEGVYLGTAFGPASVRIHELAVAVELGDSPAAVERAAAWHPPATLPAERRSHYYIDLARAQLRLGHHQDACLGLEAARQVAPQHVREHPQVRQTLSALLRTHGSPDDRLMELAAWARAR
jgi:transcriptional regulator with XRE-family HTH domain